MDIFERAIVRKIRINVSDYGNITSEDLYDLPLERLDVLAKSLRKEVEQDGDDSFITPVKIDSDIKLRFDLVVHVINYKLKLREENEQRIDKKARKERLLSIRANLEDEALKNNSIEEIDKMLAQL